MEAKNRANFRDKTVVDGHESHDDTPFEWEDWGEKVRPSGEHDLQTSIVQDSGQA